MFPAVRPEDDAEVPDTMRVFRVVEEGCLFFVALQLHRTKDAFTVEIAWSSDSRYPAFARLSGPPDHAVGQARFRMRQLWEGAGTDNWWEVNQPPTKAKADARETIEAVLGDVLVKLKADAVPFVLSHASPSA